MVFVANHSGDRLEYCSILRFERPFDRHFYFYTDLQRKCFVHSDL